MTLWQTVIYFVYKLSLNCRSFSSNRRLPTGFIFQQDSAPAHTARSAGNWLRANCPYFIRKDQWPLNSPNANSVDYHVWCAMLELTASLKQSQKQSWNSRNRQVIWSNLPEGPIYKTVKDSQIKRLKACVGAWSCRWTLRTFTVTMEFWHLIISCVVWLVSTMLLNWCCSLNIFSR